MKKYSAPFIPFLLLATGLLFFSIGRGSAANWQQLPWARAEQVERGIVGGEGCQQIQCIATSGDGSTLLFGTDVGGIYRSTDQGKLWAPSNIGYSARGARMIKFDPVNSKRVLVAACGGGEFAWHGIYLSTDGGLSWKNTFPAETNWGTFCQISFDPTSVHNGLSDIAYWSANSSKKSIAGLYRTVDGGETWKRVNNLFSCAYLQVLPNGKLLAGDDSGLWLSKDHGQSFIPLRKNPIRGLSLSAAEPGSIWVCEGYAILRSTDQGSTWTKLDASGLPTTSINNSPGWINLYVSPHNANLMFIQHQHDGSLNWEQAPRFCSNDGGATFEPVKYNLKESFFPERIEGNSGRWMTVAFDPIHANTIYMNGCDYVVKSSDEGKTFSWSNSGYTGVMCFNRFSFNPRNPNLLLLTSQDYNAALTQDGGQTWQREDVSGMGTYGFVYGGYAFDAKHMFAAAAASWTAPRYLYTTSDGGLNWRQTIYCANAKSTDVVCSCPTNSNVAFWRGFRTADQGKSWNVISGCEAVFTFSSGDDHRLFGFDHGNIVDSSDAGNTWAVLAPCPFKSVSDIAFDYVHGFLYVCGDGTGFSQYNEKTHQWVLLNARLPIDNRGHQAAKTVCVDPVNTSIVYIGNYDWYATNAAVCRSNDSGLTWQRLIKLSPNEPGMDGGHEAACVRVNPQTRDLYVTTNCYGNWRLPFQDHN